MRLMILAVLLLGAGTAYAQSPMGNVSRTLTENAVRTTTGATNQNATQGTQAGNAPTADAKPVVSEELRKEAAPAGPAAAVPGADRK
ncbi:hypothetical protein WV31_02425 [Magnetospirillum sp. ME-1]|uniref:hypothetical protein n=1 Tax=Magnetospirillum sp. ME-1 TaxID=1639348 RepID=UPI000A17C037|nr:hypothetical protein [Magnetospirillum sp. ME-1]ARJ64609.1 hypothetical protein WV31_02425 [Magnetospirillum sp. ME-1]